MTIRHLPLLEPPPFCQCARGQCDHVLEIRGNGAAKGIFLYPSEPEVLAAAIEGASKVLSHEEPKANWKTWKEFQVQGHVIFCEICRRIRNADAVYADVTTLNFNLLFEIGFAVGLGVPVIPLRDASYLRHRAELEELGMIDTIGYLNYRNAAELARTIRQDPPPRRLPPVNSDLNTRQPLYVMKGHLETEGEVRLMSLLRKSSLRFRTFDVQETPRLSLHEARRQVAASYGVVAHLLDPEREGSLVNNARGALVAGMATAMQKGVLLLQEGRAKQPIDYRDLVTEYTKPDTIERHLEPFIRRIVGLLQDVDPIAPTSPDQGLLERLNLGDVAAENEISALRDYFVRTGQYYEAKRGHARLVIGRKGSGKTAIFYAVRHSIPSTSGQLVLDLKPEGYQFKKLRELVLDELTHGLQEHTMVAFWEFILLCEIAQKIVDHDHSWAGAAEDRRQQFERIRELHSSLVPESSGDFSERLLRQIDRLVDRFAERGVDDVESHRFTAELFNREIRDLSAFLTPYLKHKKAVWLLVDNLDKGWPTRGAAVADIVIIRALLDATRKLQRQFENRDLGLSVLVFLRNDIHDLLVRQTSDRGKDTEISLDWNDPEVFKEVVRQRVNASLGGERTFEDAWSLVFDLHVGMRSSFDWVLERTLMRPRDLLSFLHRAVETAINRGHKRVSEDDLRTAERAYSEDALVSIGFELRDIYADYGAVLYAFMRCSGRLTATEVDDILAKEVGGERAGAVRQALIWFAFIGVQESGVADPVYSYQVRYNSEKLSIAASRPGTTFVIHPAFRRALEIE